MLEDPCLPANCIQYGLRPPFVLVFDEDPLVPPHHTNDTGLRQARLPADMIPRALCNDWIAENQSLESTPPNF